MNKLVKTVMIVASAGAMTFLPGCGGGTPDSVAKDMVSCLKDCDFKGMQKLATGDYKNGIAMMEGMFEDLEGEELKEAKKETAEMKIAIGAAVVNGDKATVPVTIDGKDRPMKLVKVDGKWMVEDFDFEAK
jgi:hypothetical protein